MKVRLSMAFADLRGKDGTVVISKGRTGLVARPRVRGRNPRTNAQVGVRGNLTKAATAFKNLTTVQVGAWNNYAATFTRRNPITGASYTPTAIDVFVGLAAKFLQATPAGTIPLTPPTAGFLGDSITVTAAATGPGVITFTGSAANSANVKTELLLQTLKGKNRVPGSRGYRTKSFVAFAVGALTATVNVPTGYYAAAYRFVNTATGQETPLVPLNVLTVAFAVEDGDAGSMAA